MEALLATLRHRGSDDWANSLRDLPAGPSPAPQSLAKPLIMPPAPALQENVDKAHDPRVEHLN